MRKARCVHTQRLPTLFPCIQQYNSLEETAHLCAHLRTALRLFSLLLARPLAEWWHQIERERSDVLSPLRSHLEGGQQLKDLPLNTHTPQPRDPSPRDPSPSIDTSLLLKPLQSLPHPSINFLPRSRVMANICRHALGGLSYLTVR